jgi:hypothetical protein
MARWRCGGRDGCGTVYALKLSRCPRCHGSSFEEDESMAKISRHGGPTNAAAGPGDPGHMPPPKAEEIAEGPAAVPVGEPGPEVVDFPDDTPAELPDMPAAPTDDATDPEPESPTADAPTRRRGRRMGTGESA